MEAAVSKKTYCRICTNQCGMVADMVGEQIVKVRADREHPMSKGYSCPKGRAIAGIHHHPDSITQPLMRKDGELVPVSWDEALDDIAGKLRLVIDAHGPDAIGVYFGSGIGMDASGYRLVDTFYKALGTPPKFTPITIDGAAKLLVAMQMGGFPGLGPKTDNADCDMLIYVGTNPMVSHGHNTGMFNPAGPIRAMAKRGEVWTIDPLFTETAKFSTRHLQPYPGKDYAILAWLTREIIDGGPVAPAQPIQQLAELRAALEGFDRATAAAISGVAESDLANLLAAIRTKGGVVVETGTGVTMANTANLTQWFAWILMILTGRMNRKGGVWFHPGFINQMDAFELPILDDPFSPGPPTMPDVSGFFGEWPCASLPGEIAAGNIRAFMNFGGALARSFPDTNALAPQLASLDLHVTLEIIANDTTALSTHVLPTKDQAERADIAFWDTLSGSLSMMYTPPLVRPQGERRSAWWVIAEIMRRAGLPVPDYVPESDLHEGADEAMLRSLMPHARASFDEVAASGAVVLPLEFPGPWVDAHIEKLGGWRLAPPRIVKFWNEVRAQDEAALGQPRPLCFISRRQRRKLNAALSFLGSPADIILNPADAAAHSIAHGEMVHVTTSRGEIELTANVSDTVRPGVASIPHGHEVANVNLLTDACDVDPLTGMVHYTGLPISIAPALG